uniref:hypothetical protein n=1 Tax=Dermacoccus nishinomiyaensis TaxID=1274 RepID=UPI001643306D
EAVEDGVALALGYEGGNTDEEVRRGKKMEEWFEMKRKGMRDVRKGEVKKGWGRMEKVVCREGGGKQMVKEMLVEMERKRRAM